MSSLGEEAKDWLISIVIAVVLAFFIREFIGLLVDQLWRHLSFIGGMILLLIVIAWIM